MAKQPVTHQSLLFVGTYGHVVALSKKSGRKVWETSLPSTGYSVVSIVYENERLFCASGGRVFCLDPSSGEILWSNGLKGKGVGLVYLSTVNSNNTEALMSILAQEQANQSGAAAGSAGA